MSLTDRGRTAIKPEVARYIVVHSPSYEKIAEDCADELRGAKLGKPVIRILTKPGGYLPNGETLNGILEPGGAVGVVGGDGTFADVAGGLVVPGVIQPARGKFCAQNGRQNRPRRHRKHINVL